MSRRSVCVLVVLAVALVAMVVLAGCVQGSGNVITESRDVSEFDEVELRGIGRLEITQGTTTELSVTADDNLMQYIETKVEGDTLQISVKHRSLPFFTVNPTETIVYELTVPSLTRVSLSGSGKIVVDGLETDEFTVEISGSGDLEASDLRADSFTYQLSGSGKATVSGKVDSQDVQVSGSGRLEAGDLQSAEAFIEISGSGRAVLWVTDQLDVQISGSGDVQYYGSPEVSQDVSGSGSIKGLGSK